jgi:hypothetical protein
MSNCSLKVIIGLCFMVEVLFSSSLFAQAPDTLWTRTYGGSSTDVGKSVRQTTDGGYIIAGYTNSYGGGSIDVYLIKVNANGDTLWTRTYGGSDGEAGESVRQTTDGGYIIAGIDGDPYDFYLVKADANGNMLWSKTFGGDSVDWGFSVQQTADGGYIIAGRTESFGAGGQDVFLIKTNTSGSMLWSRTYGGTGHECGYSVQQTTDGGYIITGYTDPFISGKADVYLIKTNASGDTLWTQTYGYLPYHETGRSVQQTMDGGYIIVGETNSSGAGSYDVYLIKTDINGNTLWTKTFGGSDADFGHSVQQTADGGYIIAAQIKSWGAGSYDAGLIKTDANGNMMWVRTYGSSGVEYGSSVQQTTDGSYILAGSGFGDVYVIKTEPELAMFEATPNIVNFGNVFVDSSKTDSVTVTNTGNGAMLNITSVVSDNDEFTVIPNSGNIPPGDSMKFYITFAPVDTGMEIGNVIFTHNGTTSPDTVFVVGNGMAGIEEIKDNTIPVVFRLSQGYPNPFKTETRFHYQLPHSQFVKAVIYNIAGQRVKTLIGEHKDAGFYNLYWDGKDEDSHRVNNGIYFCRMKAGEYIVTKRIISIY